MKPLNKTPEFINAKLHLAKIYKKLGAHDDCYRIMKEIEEIDGMKEFIILEEDLLESNAWKSLNGSSIIIYLCFRSKTVGFLETAISTKIEVSYEDVQRKTGQAYNTVKKGIIELNRKGFIEILRRGYSNTKSIYVLSKRFRQI